MPIKSSLACRKILRRGVDGFISPLKKVMLWIFITLKNWSLLAGFEPANLGSNGKHDNHYTTENGTDLVTWVNMSTSITKHNLIFLHISKHFQIAVECLLNHCPSIFTPVTMEVWTVFIIFYIGRFKKCRHFYFEWNWQAKSSSLYEDPNAFMSSGRMIS
jgi:hypothetical protein